MQNVQVVEEGTLPKWTFLRISMKRSRNAFRSDEEFYGQMNSFQTALQNLGIKVAKYIPGMHLECEQQSLESDIDVAIGRFANHPQNRPTLIFVIVPESEKTLVYNRVKSTCDVKHGILNVCALDTKFSRANDQYFANVGLKFNLKLGGRNHSLDKVKLEILKEKKTMVVGIDVTHPSPGSSSSAPSVAGVVASVDDTLGQWPAELRIQGTNRKEMVDDLDSMFKTRLQLWQKKNGNYPENILVYRDGVSEGQYNLVLEQELPALRKACETVYPATSTKAGKPRITIVVVGKRHHTRFYPTKREEADRSGNPQNGTVVDRGVTEARNWDFFLQAHTAIQGTAKPAHYYIVYDQIFREQKLPPRFGSAADALEDLTHNMCYLFGRATKAVSICPPAYYADLVCERARCYLSGVYDATPITSPSASIAGASDGRGETKERQREMIKVHEKVKDAMYYI